ncbi:MAG: DNA alkylation repair protein [Chloroflexota bacterium]
MSSATATVVRRDMSASGERPVSPATERARAFVAARLERAEALGRALADDVQNPADLADALRTAFGELADPEYLDGQHYVAPGLGDTHGVRTPLLGALGRGFLAATRRDSPATLLFVADRLLRERELEARWFAFRILERTLAREPERTWQLLRRAGREAADWITVDSLAHPMARGILAEPYRWAELEQLAFAPSPWERRLVGSTIATIPFVNRTTGRSPDIARRGLELLALLIGDAEPDVQKSLAWAYRSMAMVDRPATGAALEAEADRAAETGDGHRAWVVRDALEKLDPADAARIGARVAGLRRRPGAPSTSTAAATAARFADLPLGGPMPEPPLT